MTDKQQNSFARRGSPTKPRMSTPLKSSVHEHCETDDPEFNPARSVDESDLAALYAENLTTQQKKRAFELGSATPIAVDLGSEDSISQASNDQKVPQFTFSHQPGSLATHTEEVTPQAVATAPPQEQCKDQETIT